jgi:hypothetical protein
MVRNRKNKAEEALTRLVSAAGRDVPADWKDLAYALFVPFE